MAFRKRIGISKGLHLNFSGTGMGVGLRLLPGLSVSANRNGLYCNQSVPGTGFYSRNKVACWEDHQKSPSPQTRGKLQEVGKNEKITSDNTYFDFKGEVTEDNQVIVSIKRDNRPISDIELSVLKKYDGYKEALLNVHKKVVEEIQDETEEIVDIYKLTATPITEEALNKELKDLKPGVFVPKYFSLPEPDTQDIRKRLEEKAKEQISSLFFWTNNSKRNEFVERHLPEEIRKETEKWENEKAIFDKTETAREVSEKARISKEFEEKKSALENALSGNFEYVNSQIDALLSSLQMPVEFSINYDYDETNHLLAIQLDLPEIEDFPTRKACLLASGKASVKAKTKYELNHDYAVAVCGLSFFFAGMLYNTSVQIKHILVNGYTQRVNGATGSIEDQYVYSVLYNRSQFQNLHFETIDPIMAIEAFPYRMNVLKTFEMKSIQPFEIEEITSLIKE